VAVSGFFWWRLGWVKLGFDLVKGGVSLLKISWQAIFRFLRIWFNNFMCFKELGRLNILVIAYKISLE